MDIDRLTPLLHATDEIRRLGLEGKAPRAALLKKAAAAQDAAGEVVDDVVKSIADDLMRIVASASEPLP